MDDLRPLVCPRVGTQATIDLGRARLRSHRRAEAIDAAEAARDAAVPVLHSPPHGDDREE